MLLVLLGLLVTAGRATAGDRLSLTIGQISREGWAAEGVELDYRVADDDSSEASLSIRRLQLPTGESISDIQLSCPGLDPTAGTLTCRDPEFAIDLPVLGEQQLALTLTYHRDSATVSTRIEGLRAAGGTLAMEAEWHQGDWRSFIEANDVAFDALNERLAGVLPADWSAAGSLGGTLTLAGEGATPTRIIADLNARSISFNDATGLRAGEGLNGALAWRARRQGDDWIGQSELSLNEGQLYIDPVFTDFAAHPLTLTGDAVARPDDGILELLGFNLAHQGVLTAMGDASLTREPPYLARARLHDVSAQFPAAYTTYAQPFLRGTPGGDLATAGSVTARVELRDGAPTELQLRPQELTIEDSGGGFHLIDVAGHLSWAAAGREPPRTSQLSWRGGTLYGVSIGASRTQWRLHGDDVVLAESTRVPVLDGALVLNELALRDITEDERRGVLDARLDPISLQTLTASLGWPRFEGTLSGKLPSLTYEDGVATVGGTFQASVFGGSVEATNLRLRDPLGGLPELSANLQASGLDLEALTGTFAFGRITGSLDGRVENLRLLGWQPAAFRAWFQTPEDDPRPHRISQRAVENLASLGGAGGAAALSRGFLRFFEDFNYRDLGLGCVLREDVCVMRGLGDAGQGYYIVRGKGIPRVDVIGYVNTVSWPTLVEQIRGATASEGPVIE